MRELADDGFVTTPLSAGSALQESAMRACVDAGFRPRVVQEITDPYMILMLVAAGVGVALMTSRRRRHHAARHRVRGAHR